MLTRRRARPDDAGGLNVNPVSTEGTVDATLTVRHVDETAD
jgi:hypothetical protein